MDYQEYLDAGLVDEAMARETINDLEIECLKVSEMKLMLKIAKAGGLYQGSVTGSKNTLRQSLENLQKELSPYA